LNDQQLQRYARHLLLEGFGVEAQQRLLASHVLVIGAGGLGSPALLYLAAAGVGRITVVDPDVVDLTNLQRQIAHSDARVGSPKTDSAKAAMLALNPEIQVQAILARATSETLPAWVAQADLVLDCSDNFATRQAVNAACVAAGKPLAWAAAVGWNAQAGLYDPGDEASPCYACLFPPEAPVSDVACSLMGVFAPLVGQAGLLQAGEALKQLAGLDSALRRQMWMLDGQSLQAELMGVRRSPTCTVCGKNLQSLPQSA
jgi:molybdopterin/thiamine biosynthesis adenylyltransferase